MDQTAFALGLLLIGGALSGCMAGSGDQTQENAAAGQLGPEDAQANRGPILAMPVKAVYHDAFSGQGFGAWSAQSLDPNRHYTTGIVNFTGSIQGDAAFVMKEAPPQTTHLYDGTKTWSFIGSIPGCGSGSVTFAGPGFAKAEGPHVRVNVTMRMVPGTASTGLANVVDALLFAEGVDTYPLAVPMTGTVWCRPPVSTSREGARAVPVDAFYDDGGGFVSAGPDMAYVHGMVNFTGSLKGNAPFVAKLSAPTGNHHLDFTKDPEVFTGSIPGCGSGTMALFGKGFYRVDSGGLYSNLTLRLVPGSTSTGLAGLVDVVLYLDTYAWPQKVPVKGTIWCKEPVAFTRDGARAVPVRTWLDDSVNGGGGGAWSPYYVTEIINMTGSMVGDARVMMEFVEPAPSTSNPGRFGHFSKDWSFTGSIPGCGSGTISFVLRDGWGKVDPPGGLKINAVLQLVPGATSTGLVGVVDATLKIETYDYPQGRPLASGMIWCR